MRARSVLVAAVLVALNLSATAPARAGSVSWPKFRFDAANTGFNPYETILSPSNVADLRLLWRRNVQVFRSSPVVVDGVLYIGSDSDKGVVALDSATGVVLWTSHTGNIVQSTPTVDGGVVYVGSGRSVLALDAHTGTVLWNRQLQRKVWSSAAVVGGDLYVGSGNDVVSLDAADGSILWTTSVGPMQASPAVAGGRVFVVTLNDHVVHALDQATGTQLWTVATGLQGGNQSIASPAYSNGVVYVSGIPKLYAIDAVTGTGLWTGDTQFISQ